MSSIKTLDMSTISGYWNRVKTLFQVVFGVTLTESRSQEVTLFGDLKVWLEYPYSISSECYLKNKEKGTNIFLLQNNSSVIHYVSGKHFAALWGSNATLDSDKDLNCIVKITDERYFFAYCGSDKCFMDLNNQGTLFGVGNSSYNDNLPSFGKDSFVSGVVIPFYFISEYAKYNFVSNYCYWVTRAGDYLPIGSEVTAGDETFIIITHGTRLSSGANENQYYLAVKKEE